MNDPCRNTCIPKEHLVTEELNSIRCSLLDTLNIARGIDLKLFMPSPEEVEEKRPEAITVESLAYEINYLANKLSNTLYRINNKL